MPLQETKETIDRGVDKRTSGADESEPQPERPPQPTRQVTRSRRGIFLLAVVVALGVAT